MSGFTRGLDFLKDQQIAAEQRKAEQEERAKRPQIYNLWVSAGSTAKYWYLVKTKDDILAPLLHSKEISYTDKITKEQKTYQADILCQRFTMTDPISMCEHCMEGVDGPYQRPCAWTYVEQMVYTTAPKRGVEGMEVAKTPEGQKCWVEIPEPRIRMQVMKSRFARQVQSRLALKGTLFDRPFTLSRVGGSPPQDIWTPEDQENPPKEVLEAYDNVMPLEDAIYAKFGSFKKAETPTGNGTFTPPADRFSTSAVPTDF